MHFELNSCSCYKFKTSKTWNDLFEMGFEESVDWALKKEKCRGIVCRN